MILEGYFSKIKRAFLVLLLGIDGNNHLLVLCCAPNQKSAFLLVPHSKKFQGFPIDRDGQCEVGAPGVAALYFSHIQFAGAIEPKSGMPGMDLLPGTVIYNGMGESFLQSFDHFRDHQGLHGFAAVVFQPNATLAVEKGTLTVGGRGHVTVIRATPIDAEGRDYKIFQYGPGEAVALSPEGKPGVKRSADSGDVGT